MALDFHLAKTEAEAPSRKAACSFDKIMHESIFGRLGPVGQFPLFRRMEDYYNDAQYGAEELQALTEEVGEIRVRCADSMQLVEQLDMILSVCRKAQTEHLSVWVYSD